MSAFSWSSTSTSRYIDVQTFLETATTPLPLGTDGLEEEQRFAAQLAEWVSVEPPSPPDGAWRREQPSYPSQRKLHKPKPISVPRNNSIHGYYHVMQGCRCDGQFQGDSPAPASEVLARQSYNHEWAATSQFASDTSRDLADRPTGHTDRPTGHADAKPRTKCMGDFLDVLKGCAECDAVAGKPIAGDNPPSG